MSAGGYDLIVGRLAWLVRPDGYVGAIFAFAVGQAAERERYLSPTVD
jgi:hypothetical protein